MGSCNPIGIREIEPGGPFVFSPVLCSTRRKEYFERANRHLAMYSCLSIYSFFGNKAINIESKRRGIDDNTPFLLEISNHFMQTSYRQLKKSYSQSGAQLTNQVFLMLYGNFDAFLFDLVHDAKRHLGSRDPFQDTITLLSATRWSGKLDRLSQKLSLNISQGELFQQYNGVEMGFLGQPTKDPVEFLQCMADLRHRLIHGGSRADSKLIQKYPDAGLDDGDYIELPFGLPFIISYFLIPFTDYIDKSFCDQFSWEREMISPESLIT